MRSRRRSEDQDVDVQMTPLIDCVFLLLVFFLVAATLKKPHRELDLKLPHSAAADKVESQYDTLVIEMDRKGEVYIDHVQMTKQTLNEELHRVAAETPDRRVRLDVDARTPGQFIVRLLDHLQFVNLNNVGIRTRD